MQPTLSPQISRVQWLKPGHPPAGGPADLAVVIVSWNVKEFLQKNIERLSESQGVISAELVVVDNASSDGTAQMVRDQFPDVRLISNNQNLGFAKANNQGISVSHARHVLLLNPDMAVELDALQKTVDYLDAHPDAGVMGGSLSKSDGSVNPSVRRFPDVWSQLFIILKIAHFFPRINRRYLFSDFNYDVEQQVDTVRGSYFAINGKLLEQIGGLDERYFLWFEEVDYCRQAKKNGWKVMFVPWIHAVDFVGKSFSQNKRFLAQKRFTRSLIQYIRKWHPRWQSVVLTIARPIGLFFNWLGDLLTILPRTPFSFPLGKGEAVRPLLTKEGQGEVRKDV